MSEKLDLPLLCTWHFIDRHLAKRQTLSSITKMSNPPFCKSVSLITLTFGFQGAFLFVLAQKEKLLNIHVNYTFFLFVFNPIVLLFGHVRCATKNFDFICHTLNHSKCQITPNEDFVCLILE